MHFLCTNVHTSDRRPPLATSLATKNIFFYYSIYIFATANPDKTSPTLASGYYRLAKWPHLLHFSTCLIEWPQRCASSCASWANSAIASNTCDLLPFALVMHHEASTQRQRLQALHRHDTSCAYWPTKRTPRGLRIRNESPPRPPSLSGHNWTESMKKTVAMYTNVSGWERCSCLTKVRAALSATTAWSSTRAVRATPRRNHPHAPPLLRCPRCNCHRPAPQTMI